MDTRQQTAYDLPRQITSFIGREQEITDILALLDNCQLLTLVGPGGIGKTRLAVEVAARAGASFANGVCFVPLAALNDPANMPLAIAQHAGYPFQPDGPKPKDQLLRYLANKSLLLLLDNCEHLLAGSDLIADILQAAPGVKVLATSREILNLQAEWVFRVGGLAIPGSDDEVHPDQYSAVALFAERARQVRPDFSLGDHARAVTRLCRMVEGMPLALVLAAAWLETLSPEAIAVEIGESVDFLATEMRDMPPRHRSIRAVFDPTWARLSETEQAVFMKFAVFRGGCTRAAAQAVTEATLGQLQALVNRALLTRVAEDRYEMHELLRQYAQAKLDESGLGDAAREAHARYYAEALSARTEAIDLGPWQLETLTAIEADFENVRAAWAWALDGRHWAVLDLMVEPLNRFYNLRNHFRDVLAWFAAAIEQVVGTTDSTSRRLLSHLLTRHSFHSVGVSHAEKRARIQTALDIAREYGDQAECAYGLLVLGSFMNDHHQALRLIEESLAMSRAIGWRLLEADCIGTIAHLLASESDRAAQSQEYLEQCLALYRGMESKTGIAVALAQLGRLAFMEHRLDDAETYYLESLELYGEVRVWGYFIIMLIMLATLAEWRLDFEKARRYTREMATLIEDYNLIPSLYHTGTLLILGRLALLEGNYTEARRLLDEGLNSASKITLHPVYAAIIHTRLGEALIGLEEGEAGATHVVAALGMISINFFDVWIGNLGLADVRFALAACLEGVSLVLAQRGQPTRALEIASLVVHSKYAPPWLGEKHPLLRAMLNDLANTLDPATFDAAWERGKTLDMTTTVRELRAEFGLNPDDASAEGVVRDVVQAANEALVEPLTSRELEILRLIGAGHTNRQIAEELVVVEDTVKKHITHLYGKLEVSNRTQAIRRGREKGLLA